MDCRPLAFRQVPHQPKLFLEYLDRFEKVKSFYFHPPALTAVTRVARKLDYPGERRAEVSTILRKQNMALGAGADTLSNLDRLSLTAFSKAGLQRFSAVRGKGHAVSLMRFIAGVQAEAIPDLEARPVGVSAVAGHRRLGRAGRPEAPSPRRCAPGRTAG